MRLNLGIKRGLNLIKCGYLDYPHFDKIWEGLFE
jgi:hypothetical protein